MSGRMNPEGNSSNIVNNPLSLIEKEFFRLTKPFSEHPLPHAICPPEFRKKLNYLNETFR
jgi:hypothetical protein